MFLRRIIPLLLLSFLLASCWTKYRGDYYQDIRPKVWGFKPLYGTDTSAKKIIFSQTPQTVRSAGNIYVYQQYIFQMELGAGIHVIDNSIPASARRVGFITVKGCSQISIKGGKLYTNSYDDLVVIDVADQSNIRESSRLKGVFPEFRYGSPLAQPPSSGYYECPRHDSLVVAWKMDSVNQYCYKN